MLSSPTSSPSRESVPRPENSHPRTIAGKVLQCAEVPSRELGVPAARQRILAIQPEIKWLDPDDGLGHPVRTVPLRDIQRTQSVPGCGAPIERGGGWNFVGKILPDALALTGPRRYIQGAAHSESAPRH